MSQIIDINWIFHKYYAENPKLQRIVMVHSEQVAKKALEICREKKLNLDPIDVYCAAMLHDIGVVNCNAPDINARGILPYLCHGVEGCRILEKEGLCQYARICISHTGAGITTQEIIDKNLPLPVMDMTPHSLLEKLICYADKFFSKSKDLTKEKNVEEIISQMKKFGSGSLNRFLDMHLLFA